VMTSNCFAGSNIELPSMQDLAARQDGHNDGRQGASPGLTCSLLATIWVAAAVLQAAVFSRALSGQTTPVSCGF